MLRAALIGLPSGGKTTLFQLMTSAKDAPRGKGDVNIGISKVPDARLDILTAMYNPKKRVPATVEFTDIIAPAKTGAQALVDVAGYKNADALVHVLRAFRDAAVPHAHPPERGPRAVDVAQVEGFGDAPVLVGGHVPEKRAHGHDGAVDPYVDGAERRLDRCGGGLDLFGVAHVGRHGERPPAERLDLEPGGL